MILAATPTVLVYLVQPNQGMTMASHYRATGSLLQCATLDDSMKERMKELGEAINETLANSDQIAEVISRIKAEGYDVFLVLEATVGFNRQESEAAATGLKAEPQPISDPELKVNAHDVRFLKSLKISVDNEKAA
jgi:hypothetical protein